MATQAYKDGLASTTIIISARMWLLCSVTAHQDVDHGHLALLVLDVVHVTVVLQHARQRASLGHGRQGHTRQVAAAVVYNQFGGGCVDS